MPLNPDHRRSSTRRRKVKDVDKAPRQSKSNCHIYKGRGDNTPCENCFWGRERKQGKINEGAGGPPDGKPFSPGFVQPRTTGSDSKKEQKQASTALSKAACQLISRWERKRFPPQGTGKSEKKATREKSHWGEKKKKEQANGHIGGGGGNPNRMAETGNERKEGETR